jgi:hypothetical protein
MSSPDTLVSPAASPERDGSPQPTDETSIEERSPLYQSLLAAVDLPKTAKQEWLETVADFQSNPRLLNKAPYNDGALHWVDNGGHVLGLGFPAILDRHGKYGRLGPYFNMAGDQGVKVKVSKYMLLGD